ncbi:MAG: cytochrome c biogenesis protein CcsA [Vicingaceae bacterium]
MEITYLNEHLVPGQIGNIFVATAFVCALFAGLSYFLAEKRGEQSWRSMGRWFFRIHSISILGITASLFYIIFNHYFEYNYAYQHSSTDLPLRYIFSCFWEGQEGSFLLWTFWHVVLGNILIHTSGKWENSVMAVFASVQVLLGSMLLGVYVLGLKIGSNPFLLLRQNPDMMNIPIFQNPTYTDLIEGTGLNPLLQNYWMTIHPPTLFLGFASTLIPFCFAIASLWKRSYHDWLKPTLPWAYFGIMILGTGVLMGGAWAYEALSFGGFWAWDPVENASLVPWMFFVAAGHLMLINQKKDRPTSLLTTYAITILTFLLVLYSTYLTRSGILGDTSVHSFADGMPGQLIFFMALYVIFSAGILIFRSRELPSAAEEEVLMSREFWMFIGALVMVIAAFQITFTTSIPVINAIFGTNMAPPVDAVAHFNSWQIPFAIIIALLMALSQFLKYRKTDFKDFIRKIALSSSIALILAVLIAYSFQIANGILIFMLFASLLTAIANLDYFTRILKGKIKNGGASIAHIGFGLVLLGSLLSAGLQETISVNTSGIDIRMKGEEGNANLENILLYKNDTLSMGDFRVTYAGKKKEGINMFYEVNYSQKESAEKEGFSLFPRIQLNKMMGNVPEPDTRHFWNRDLFTYVSYVNQQDFDEEYNADYQVADTFVLSKGDSEVFAPYLMTLRTVSTEVDRDSLKLTGSDIAIKAVCAMDDMHGKITVLEPILVIRDNRIFYIHGESAALGVRLSLVNVNPEDGSMTIIYEKDQNKKEDFIIMKAVIFPYINVLWIGCLIMILGIALSIYNRISRNRSK